ncbi:hypothetical protein C8P66_10855 [Humitalea rosea]|uniref:Uncharacterized protein n=1 Tax=Humitalea rosea TaxID=990373 RepID=A0A2W7J525_9PROT|nr:hypothetical protein C8P66_10855 [Humitalea rosea]
MHDVGTTKTLPGDVHRTGAVVWEKMRRMTSDQGPDEPTPSRRFTWPAAALLILVLCILAWLLIGAITWWFLH